MVEALVALAILALASAGFAVSTGGGLRMIGTSQERQTAVQVANEWMEQARVIPFDGLALPDTTVFEGVGTPDEDVTGGTTYTSEAGTETLVLESGSTFEHVEYEEVNNILYSAYRYITWVADGANTQAYKRVTIVVQWAGTSTGADPTKRVTLSSIVSSEGVAWSSTTSTSTPATSTTTTSSTTTTTAAPGTCDGDVTAPSGSFSILAGSGASAGYTSSSTVTLSLTATDPCADLTMAFSNDGTSFSAPVLYAASAVWTLEAGNGTRTMWTKFTDGVGNALTLSSSVVVDTDAPTTPGSFTATVLNAPKRVELTWTQSTDNQGVLGYRIYVRKGSAAFQNQSTGVVHPCPTSPCTWTHSGVKTKDTYTYYVVSYDAAGNESDAPTALTRTI